MLSARLGHNRVEQLFEGLKKTIYDRLGDIGPIEFPRSPGTVYNVHADLAKKYVKGTNHLELVILYLALSDLNKDILTLSIHSIHSLIKLRSKLNSLTRMSLRGWRITSPGQHYIMQCLQLVVNGQNNACTI